ncbi:MAG: hypothetical protein IBJ11_12250 [Phycisphaerales bacterium]|nr:hypothetical protein [Phycisphaerales bacterium]
MPTATMPALGHDALHRAVFNDAAISAYWVAQARQAERRHRDCDANTYFLATPLEAAADDLAHRLAEAFPEAASDALLVIAGELLDLATRKPSRPRRSGGSRFWQSLRDAFATPLPAHPALR